MPLEPVPQLNPLNVTVQPFYIATVVNGIVYDVMNVNGQQAAMYLTQPKFVQVNNGDTGIGWLYDEETGTFTAPRSL
jgi:hypothetical protein